MALLLATAGGAGYAPVAPGTFGSAVGVVLWLPLSRLAPWLLLVTITALLFVGIWASDEAERAFATKDDGRIVIDEVVGQLLTLAPLALVGTDSALHSPAWLLAGFLLFRALDIAKFGPIGWAERRFENGAGVMMDDVVAGALGGVVLGSLYVAAVAFGIAS